MKLSKNSLFISYALVVVFSWVELKPMDNVPKPGIFLDIIKEIQAQKLSPDLATEKLVQMMQGSGTDFYSLTHPTFKKGREAWLNILHYLDQDCNANTVQIILDTIQDEEEACKFIMNNSTCPSALEFVLRKNYIDCAVPMIKLLWKNNKALSIIQPCFFVGLKQKRFVINDLFNKKLKKVGPATEKIILCMVAEKLRRNLDKKTPENSDYWLELEK